MGELKMYATLTEKAEKLAACKAIYEQQGPKALIEAVSGWTHFPLFDLLWEGAMSEHFGPCGMHKSWTNEDGTPSAAALESSDIVEAIERGKEKIARVFTWVERGTDVPYWN